MSKLVLMSKMISPYNSIFPGNTKNVLFNYTRIPLGDVSNSYVALIHSHNGTHLDVPFHFFEDGKKLTDYSVRELIFTRVKIVEVEGVQNNYLNIDDLQLTLLEKETEVLIIKVHYCSNVGKNEGKTVKNVGLSAEAAQFIRDKTKLKLIGTDSISISHPENPKEGMQAHRILLSTNVKSEPVLILEDMEVPIDIKEIERLFICPLWGLFPDGGPCSVIAELP